MTAENLPIITISREYGAGGRSVAKGLSEKLGIPWYDQDFVTETARDSGYEIGTIESEGEELSQFDKILDYIMKTNVSYNSSHDGIFEAQKKEVLKLSGSPCIIVGRLSNFILRENGIKTFDVFLHADMEHKIKRISELKENGKTEIKKFIEKREALRRNYYRHYTNKTLGDYRDYALSIDTGKIGMEGTVTLILEALKSAD
ncbi:MAG: cytidylate kinase-like family protein [Treponema sp.]|nr:cytidylate kinase-like family protein [Treponema sp.]MBQ2600981.1 cytidylate kinase-like family protein [Treponema sp.]